MNTQTFDNGNTDLADGKVLFDVWTLEAYVENVPEEEADELYVEINAAVSSSLATAAAELEVRRPGQVRLVSVSR